MSVIKKPYELSVWEQRWDSQTQKFLDIRIGVIGSDKMEFQGRAIEPMLTRNVNGEKKLTFKMYKHFIDNASGEKIENPFSDWLINERKVRLHYEGKWYDFVIKNVTENSTNYLYTYSLVDASVNELLKNGFGVTLDAELNNNTGSAKQLAETTLAETDWEVESEVLVQTIEESLVYVNTAAELQAYRIYDQKDNRFEGVKISDEPVMIPKNTTLLAFYSSCTGKPHRFQFIYLQSYDLDKIPRDENRNILIEDCQYFVEFEPSEYLDAEPNYGFFMPNSIAVLLKGDSLDIGKDSTISSQYRGRRYVFSHQAEYLPKLEKTVQLYSGPEYEYKDGEETKKSNLYCGYAEAHYASPIIAKNIITNADFGSGKTGWYTGFTSSDQGKAPTIEAVVGKFSNNTFKDAISIFQSNGADGYDGCKAYLKVTLESGNILLNSGPTDFRTSIKNMTAGDTWEWEGKIYTDSGVLIDKKSDYFLGQLGEFTNTNSVYSLSTKNFESKSGATSFQIKKNTYTENTFQKNSKIRFGLVAKQSGTYYIESLMLYKLIIALGEDGKHIYIKPDNGDGKNEEYYIGEIKTTYNYFKKDGTNYESLGDVIYSSQVDSLSYQTYKPIYNSGAEKIRGITAKESNYFNILQSIAETFEAWLDLKIERDSSGAIIRKVASFKNYIGQENPVGLKYGVNLKDVQRVCESQQIVNKLIVRPNSNELAENGVCTIQTANSNETGEDHIYDFQYYFNMGLMDVNDYLDTVYYYEGARGADLDAEEQEWTINGYYPRIRELNNQILDLNKEYINISEDYTILMQNYTIAEAGMNSATTNMENIEQSFSDYTGINFLMTDNSKRINKTASAESIKNAEIGKFADQPGLTVELNSFTDDTKNKVLTWLLNFKLNSMSYSDKQYDGYIKFKALTFRNGEVKNDQLYLVSCTIPAGGTEGVGSFSLIYGEAPNLQETGDIQKLIYEYVEHKSSYEKYLAQYTGLSTQKADLEKQANELAEQINTLKDYKAKLNELFYKKYSSYIQEGVWMSEDYIDGNKYYADALSVLYNSCYPKVSYTINPIRPEFDEFGLMESTLGDKTFVEDVEFFGQNEDGSPVRTEIIASEKVDNLDSQDKTTIKVQNFKNEFQDLFQKINATVQQAQYNTGSYEKAVALAEANAQKKGAFLKEALSDASTMFSTAGQQSVVQGVDGITITDLKTPCNQIRMIGGAIMVSKDDGKGDQKWSTAITGNGISASLLTSGAVNTGEISIMNGKEPAFKWDALGITAYGGKYSNAGVSAINTKEFVRIDKYGIYGMKDVDGTTYYPKSQSDIDTNATFALTWEGLKVTGNDKVVAKIGKSSDNKIINITDKNNKTIFSVGTDGTTLIGGCSITDGTLYVKNANISGTISGSKISAGSITATQIAGSTITGAEIKGNTLSGIFANLGTIKTGELLSDKGMSINLNNGTIKFTNFEVDADGNITASNANISGTITADKGSISRFDIVSTGITGKSYKHATNTTNSIVNVGLCPGNDGSGDYYQTSGAGDFYKDGFRTNCDVVSIFAGTTSISPPSGAHNNGTCDALFMVFGNGDTYMKKGMINTLQANTITTGTITTGTITAATIKVLDGSREYLLNNYIKKIVNEMGQ